MNLDNIPEASKEFNNAIDPTCNTFIAAVFKYAIDSYGTLTEREKEILMRSAYTISHSVVRALPVIMLELGKEEVVVDAWANLLACYAKEKNNGN